MAQTFQNSIHDGIFPDLWKEAVVTAISKNINYQIKTNYRTSLYYLPSLKFWKKMFSKLYTTQPSNRKNSGFKPNVSAMNRLLAILEEIYQGFDDHNDSIFVYINIF